MKLLVFGQTGQVARELIRRTPAGVSIETLGRDRADFSCEGHKFCVLGI
jgi:dTDP-4-dehydrorhamnose reductase